MRAKIILLLALSFFLFTSCEEDEPRVNVEVWVQFNVETTLGEAFPGVDVFLETNKYSISSGQATGTAFTRNTTTDASGIVEWRGVTYNINSDEAIRISAYGSIEVMGVLYSGETTIFYNSGDAPGFLKTQTLTINF